MQLPASIWSAKSHDRNAHAAIAMAGSQPVHFCLNANPNVVAEYRDKNKDPIQHDRAFTTEMPNISAVSFWTIIRDSMQAAHTQAVGSTHGFKAPAPKKEHDTIRNTRGGTTATLLLYDPVSFSFALGTRGDSPAFIIFDDGMVHALQISSTLDANEKGGLQNHVNYPISVLEPIHPAVYHFGDYEQPMKPIIPLATLIDQAVEVFKLDKAKLKTSLLVTSDGLFKPIPETGLSRDYQEACVIAHYENAKKSLNKHHDNLAERMIHSAITTESRDNLSAILIEDIQPGKGLPIAAAVCDGFYKRGGDVAHSAIRGMEDVIARAVMAANPGDPVIKKNFGARLIPVVQR